MLIHVMYVREIIIEIYGFYNNYNLKYQHTYYKAPRTCVYFLNISFYCSKTCMCVCMYLIQKYLMGKVYVT